jgi:uncharacterized protein YkwD
MLSVSAVLLTTSGVLAALPAPANEDVKFYLHPVEAQIIEHTNAERARFGLPILQIDTSLMQSARRHGSWMATRQSLQHTSAQVAENIAMGQSSSSEAVRDWMNSPGHRANILNGSYRRIGAAAYVSPSGAIYWCQQFLH